MIIGDNVVFKTTHRTGQIVPFLCEASLPLECQHNPNYCRLGILKIPRLQLDMAHAVHPGAYPKKVGTGVAVVGRKASANSAAVCPSLVGYGYGHFFFLVMREVLSGAPFIISIFLALFSRDANALPGRDSVQLGRSDINQFRVASLDDFRDRLGSASLPVCHPYNRYIYPTVDGFSLDITRLSTEQSCGKVELNEMSFCVARFFLRPIVDRFPPIDQIIYPASDNVCARRLIDDILVHFGLASEYWEFVKKLIETPRFYQSQFKQQLVQYAAERSPKWKLSILQYFDYRFGFATDDTETRNSIFKWAIEHYDIDLVLFIFQQNSKAAFNSLYRLLMERCLNSSTHYEFSKRVISSLKMSGFWNNGIGAVESPVTEGETVASGDSFNGSSDSSVVSDY